MQEKRRLIIASILCFAFFLMEFIGSIISNSLALLSDSFHLLTDLLSFGISLFAIYLSTREKCHKFNFGRGRVEVLGALASIILIYACTFWLCIEAIDRLQHPENIDGKVMFGIALVGVFFNIILMITFHHHGHDHHHHHHSHSHGYEHAHDHESGDQNHEEGPPNDPKRSVNIRAAILHIIGDLVASVGVLIASCFIMIDQIVTEKMETKFLIMDPICTFIFSSLVIATTVPLLKECIIVLMESNPNLNNIEVKNKIEYELGANVIEIKSWLVSMNDPYCIVVVENDPNSRQNTSMLSDPDLSSMNDFTTLASDSPTMQILLTSKQRRLSIRLSNEELEREIRQLLVTEGIPSENCYIIIQ